MNEFKYITEGNRHRTSKGKNPIKISDEAAALMDKLVQEGFTGLNIPAGSSHDGGHCSFGVHHRINPETEKAETLAVPYDFFAGGERTVDKGRDETPGQTLVREQFEETGLTVGEGDYELVKEAEEYLPARDAFEGHSAKCEHYKHWFLIHQSKGELADFSQLEDKRNPIEKETGSPLWVPNDILAEIVFYKQKLSLGHCWRKLVLTQKDYAFTDLPNNQLVRYAQRSIEAKAKS